MNSEKGTISSRILSKVLFISPFIGFIFSDIIIGGLLDKVKLLLGNLTPKQTDVFADLFNYRIGFNIIFAFFFWSSVATIKIILDSKLLKSLIKDNKSKN